eukprot:scaffold1369_cov163-Amphora_coffeaeformis.AAC.3
MSSVLNMTTDMASDLFQGGYNSNTVMTHPSMGRLKPLLAVVACTRSKGDWRHINSTSLHSLLIPSIEKTVTVRELRQYRIEFVIGFDKGDPFWEQETNRKHLSEGSLLPINFVSIPKKKHRPHQIPFNQLCRAAYDYGADYIVRVNDDSEFVTTNWITHSVQRLQAYSPPNVGVVGPTCKQGNTAILTHDLVHRTHLDIFNDYYPDEFDNWWIDDWITRVYGPSRTTKLRTWEIRHHVDHHGTRYTVNEKLKAQLIITLERGRKSIDTYLQHKIGETGKYRVLGTDRIHDVYGPMKAFHNKTFRKR